MKHQSPDKVRQEEILAAAVQVLGGMPGLACAYVHGSFCTARFRPDSDLDLALLFFPGQRPDSLQLLDLAAEMESRIGRPAHLGVMSSRNVVFVKEVISKGRRIFCVDRYYCDTFIMHALAMYVQLNEDRAEILKNYAA
ncbi:MAG: type VII toxin-antitoxin system MntA family adenylyltransferase antitoxin [Thermodesulfobacteriota bacterium]